MPRLKHAPYQIRAVSRDSIDPEIFARAPIVEELEVHFLPECILQIIRHDGFGVCFLRLEISPGNLGPRRLGSRIVVTASEVKHHLDQYQVDTQ
jgi:hypothetical protein